MRSWEEGVGRRAGLVLDWRPAHNKGIFKFPVAVSQEPLGFFALELWRPSFASRRLLALDHVFLVSTKERSDAAASFTLLHRNTSKKHFALRSSSRCVGRVQPTEGSVALFLACRFSRRLAAVYISACGAHPSDVMRK